MNDSLASCYSATGGAGSDGIWGGPDHDHLYGGDHADSIFGEYGKSLSKEGQ